jgi:hypothetical protein
MAGRKPPPDVAIGERALPNEALLDCPSVELVERGNGAVPGGSRDAVGGLVMPARTMIGIDVLARGLPHRLGARLVEEAHPDEQIVSIAAQAMLGAHAVERQVGEEAVKMWIVGRAVAHDTRGLGLAAPALRCSPLRRQRCAFLQ